MLPPFWPNFAPQKILRPTSNKNVARILNNFKMVLQMSFMKALSSFLSQAIFLGENFHRLCNQKKIGVRTMPRIYVEKLHKSGQNLRNFYFSQIALPRQQILTASGLPKYNRILKFFYFPSLPCSQIGLISLMDDYQCGQLHHKVEQKAPQ